MDVLVSFVCIRLYQAVSGLLIVFALAANAAPRVPNTTLTLPASPPQSGFATTTAFGSLTFTNPVVVVAPPGETNRLFIVEQGGIVAVITNLAVPTRSVFLNIVAQVAGGSPTDERGLLGLAFHPGYATNGHFFVYYSSTNTLTTNLNSTVNTGNFGLHQCVSRFAVSAGNSNAANPASELRLLVMADDYNNHNGGCLQFGPDNYLYISTGDEGGAGDAGSNSQRIDKDLWAGMLRLDVDLPSTNLMPTTHAAQRFTGWNGVVNYRVPADNPFVGATNFNGIAFNTNLLRAEFWAVGLRNPWRFSFDSLDGKLYLGDLGQGSVEEIDVITRGGNYGWVYREGNTAYSIPPAGFTNAIEPIVTYIHGSATNQGNSVSGGVVYRGNRIPSLYGKYIFADYVSGRIWAAQPNGTNVVPFGLLATDASISGFGVDPRNGDVLICDQSEDTIKRLITATNLTGASLLSGTGAFTNLTTLTAHAGILPYEINAPFWSDNAMKSRWFSMPNTNLTMTFSPEANWQFPTGSVWIKHFDLETNTITHAMRRLETRFIVRYTNGVYGLTYRWTTPPTNALLVAEEGFSESIIINDNGNLRTQVWNYPGRGECLSCHSTAGGGALGFGTLQLNRAVTNGGGVNQIQMLSDAGYFSSPVSNVNSLRSFAHPTNESASLEWRARSYLNANCSFCHQPGGTIGSWDARFSTPTRFANLINGTPFNNFGDTNNHIITPGSTNLSLIHARMSTRSAGSMPPLGSSLVDTNGTALLARWITTDLTNYQRYADWQTQKFGGTNVPNSGEQEDYDADGAKNYLEYLTGTDPLLSTSGWGLAIAAGASNTVDVSWQQPANRAVELQWNTNLAAPAVWQSLDSLLNQPFHPASNRTQQVTVPMGETNVLFFRARVSEP